MFYIPYCQTLEIKNNKLLSLSCDILSEFLIAHDNHFGSVGRPRGRISDILSEFLIAHDNHFGSVGRRLIAGISKCIFSLFEIQNC